MNTAYNTTTVQESRNRYNALLAQALERIKARKTDKTAQQPEEVTTTATDMYHGYLDDKKTLQAGRIKATLEKSVRLDSNGSVLTWREHIDRLWRAGGLWGYKHLDVYTDYTSTDTKYIARTEWRISTPQSRAEYDGYYIANKTVVEYVKHLLALSGEDVTAGDPTEMEVLRYDARLLYLEMCKSSAYGEARGLIKECIDKLTAYYTLEGGKSKREIAEAIYNDLRPKLRKIASFGILSEVGVYLDGFVKQATEDATPAPADIEEEATPATAPQATEEDTTTAPEEVATEEATVETPVQEPEEVTTEEVTAPADIEEEEMRKRREADDITVLKYCVEHCGEVGADYLDTLDYTQAEAREYRSVKGGVSKPEQKYYTTEDGIIYGLFRRYNRNGKRAEFVVYQDGQIIEVRTYGKNNNTYKAELRCAQTEGSIVRYEVKDGKVTRAEYLLTRDDKKPLSVEFDDTNRPETPRDLPAPATTKPTKPTSKETTAKEETATTVQEQPTSETATTEEVTVPEEVTTVTTSKQEDDTTPYWLLLDNELKAQQQEQAPATPEKSEPEEQAEEPDNEETDDLEEVEKTEEVVFLKGAELNKVIEEYADKNRLDFEYQKKQYYFYATADGYLAILSKPKMGRNLYIADEGPYYEKYQKGAVTEKDVFFSNNMQSIRRHKQLLVYTPEKGKTECDLFVTICSNSDNTYIEMPNRQTSPREVAVYEAVHRLYISDQRARLEKYWKRYSDKVWVDTYWANR